MHWATARVFCFVSSVGNLNGVKAEGKSLYIKVALLTISLFPLQTLPVSNKGCSRSSQSVVRVQKRANECPRWQPRTHSGAVMGDGGQVPPRFRGKLLQTF